MSVPRCVASPPTTFLDAPGPLCHLLPLQPRVLLSHGCLVLMPHFLELYREPKIDAFCDSLPCPVVFFKSVVFFLGANRPTFHAEASGRFSGAFPGKERGLPQPGFWWVLASVSPLPGHLVAITTVFQIFKPEPWLSRLGLDPRPPHLAAVFLEGLQARASSTSAARLPEGPEGNLFIDNLKQSEVFPTPERARDTPRPPSAACSLLFTAISVFTLRSLPTRHPRNQ